MNCNTKNDRPRTYCIRFNTVQHFCLFVLFICIMGCILLMMQLLRWHFMYVHQLPCPFSDYSAFVLLDLLFAAVPIIYEQNRGYNTLDGSLPFVGVMVGTILAAAISTYITFQSQAGMLNPWQTFGIPNLCLRRL